MTTTSNLQSPLRSTTYKIWTFPPKSAIQNEPFISYPVDAISEKEAHDKEDCYQKDGSPPEVLQQKLPLLHLRLRNLRHRGALRIRHRRTAAKGSPIKTAL